MMITIYTYPSHAPSRKAIKWFKDNNVEYTERRVTIGDMLSEDELMKMLRMVDDVYDLISTQSKTYRNVSARIEGMKIRKQLIPFLQKNAEIVNFPVVMNERIISTGFSEKNLKRFFPKDKRVQLLHELVETIEKQDRDPTISKIDEDTTAQET